MAERLSLIERNIAAWSDADGFSLFAGDPGGVQYTALTFGPRRYENPILSSYGHPVPVVAGKLQRKGRAAAAKVLKADFTDDCDTLVLDCTAAYDVPALKSLVRTVAFDRKSGLIAVSDAVSFSEPSAVEVPIITYRNYEHDGSARHFEFSKPKKNLARTMTLDVSASADFAFRDEKIENPGKHDVARLAFAFREPVLDATMTMRFSTGSRPKAARMRADMVQSAPSADGAVTILRLSPECRTLWYEASFASLTEE